MAHAEPTDVVIVDCLLLGALDTLVRGGLQTVSLVHTLWSFFEGEARGPVGAILRLRGIRMRPVLRSPALSLVTVRADFEAHHRPESITSARSGRTRPAQRSRLPGDLGYSSA